MSLARDLGAEAFDEATIDDETRSVNRIVEQVLAAIAPIHTQTPAEIRAARERGEGPLPALQISPRAKTRSIPGPDGPIPLRIFEPAAPRGVYLHIHGGGWVLGAAHQQDPLLESIADRCSLAVVSVDYRLAPEHPYPAGPDDCEAAASWLVRHAKSEFGSDRLLIGGESAGAHLSAVTLVRMRDRHGFRAFAGANLVFGCYDLGLTPSARRWGDRNLVLSTPIMDWFADHFVAAERRRDPDVSPIHADLAGLPPALFTVGTLDPLLDDSLFMHARWLASGNRSDLALYPGCIHGFTAFPNRAGRDAHERQLGFLAERAAAP
ncbi:epsilon-lactone hydrolase [Myxococcaceae bacterium]|jgi:acetyl esterase/lipase|nr:epsilon-lactone hydrolase [Myxococcaceae bacterium]